MEENQIKQRRGSEEYENFLEERNDDGEYSRQETPRSIYHYSIPL